MKRFTLLLLLFVARLCAAQTPLETLVNAERAFSRMSEEKGRKAAFIEFFAADSVIFKQNWIPGRKYHGEQPESAGNLTWEPRIADISEKGDLGYTTGPWQFRKDQNVAHGYYMSIWKRQPNGKWKVVLDQGISTPGPSTMQKNRPIWAPGSELDGQMDAGRAQQTLLDQERVFAQMILKKGLSVALKEMAVADFLLYRDRNEPATGDVAFQFISQTPIPQEMIVQKAETSGRLGYAYGEWSRENQAGQKMKGGFVRIWKQNSQGEWKIVLDLTFPSAE